MFRYRFATKETRDQFTSEPEKYSIQFGGDCGAMPGNGPANASLFLVLDEKLYIFGSPTCRSHFLERPKYYLEQHVAAEE